MNRNHFDEFIKYWHYELAGGENKDAHERIKQHAVKLMQPLSDTERYALVDDYKQLAREKRTALRERAETMTALASLWEFSPDLFSEKSHAKGAFLFLGPGFEDAAEQYLNAEHVVLAMYEALTQVQQAERADNAAHRHKGAGAMSTQSPGQHQKPRKPQSAVSPINVPDKTPKGRR